MIHLFPILLLGVLILVLLLWLLWRTRGEENDRHVSIEQYSHAQETVNSVITGFCVVRRMFAPEDMEFISRQPAQELTGAFLKERKELAISSIRQTRQQIAVLVSLHFKLASYTYEPSPKFEFTLFANYLWFIVVCHFLIFSIRLRGPFEVGKMVDQTLAAAEQFCHAVSDRLEKTNPGRLSPARQNQAA